MTIEVLPRSERRDHPTLGIVTFIGNLILMVLISAMVKTMSVSYPLSELLLLRFVFAMLFFWVILLSTGGVRGLATKRLWDHGFRSASGITSLALFYYAISEIPMADATALTYSAPIFITFLSIFLLRETIGIQRWIAVIAGFVGVLLIAQPGGSGWNAGIVAGIASAVTGALVAIWLRRLSSSEKSVTIGIYYNTSGTLVCLVWALLSGWILPQGSDFILLLVFGLMCGAQQWLLTISFRYAEASLLAPFEYVTMIFAAFAGYYFWDEIPVSTTWLGAGVIAASGIYIFLRRQKIRKVKET